jgi:hypothetical protein
MQRVQRGVCLLVRDAAVQLATHFYGDRENANSSRSQLFAGRSGSNRNRSAYRFRADINCTDVLSTLGGENRRVQHEVTYSNSNSIVREVFMCVYCLPNKIDSVCSVQLNFKRIMMSRAHVGRTNSLNACLNVAANSCCCRSSWR